MPILTNKYAYKEQPRETESHILFFSLCGRRADCLGLRTSVPKLESFAIPHNPGRNRQQATQTSDNQSNRTETTKEPIKQQSHGACSISNSGI
mmetsp:Transcript_10261/g.28184  ORF Transcript_10261/g.28184 Transcript_10261/m.28184 type:complete len:93 (+) Transcript_10261:2080-2358(+)